jgi:hypothetical protein
MPDPKRANVAMSSGVSTDFSLGVLVRDDLNSCVGVLEAMELKEQTQIVGLLFTAISK